MALPIRDGNQTLTTLSTIIVNSAHVPAHSVVSLGSQAITDIAVAVSGVELGPNSISALEHISVTISAGTSLTIGNVVSVTGGLTNAELRASSVTIGGSVQVSNFPATQSVTFSSPTITGSVSVLNLPATQAVTFTQAPVTFGNIAGSVTAVISGTPSVTFTQASVTFTQASVTFGQAVVSASNIGDLLSSVATDNTPDATTKFVKIGGHQSGSNQTSHIVHVSAGGSMSVDASGSSVTFTQASVTFSSITGSVSVLNFPATQTTTFSAITGSVSVLNLPATQTVTFTQASVTFGTPVVTGSVSVLNFPSTQTIAGTVTANANVVSIPLSAFPDTWISGGDTLKVDLNTIDTFSPATWLHSDGGNVPISGTVTVGSLPDGVSFGQQLAEGYDNYGGAPVQIVGSSITQSISGTVTASLANVVTTDSFWNTQAIKITGGNGYGIDIAGEDANGNRAIFDEGGGVPVFPREFSGNFPIAGTVTIGASSVTFNAYVGQRGDGTWSPISLQTGSNYVNTNVWNSVTIGSLPAISGTVTVGGFSSVSVGGTLGSLLVGGKRGSGVESLTLDVSTGYLQTKVESMPSISGSVTIGAGTAQIGSVTASISNSITVASLPAISGTVTANTAYATSITGYAGVVGSVTALPVVISDKGIYGGNFLGYNGSNTFLNVGIASVGQTSLSTRADLPVSGTITIGNSITIGSIPSISGTVTIGAVSTSVTVSQIQGTSVTTSNFTSTTASTTLASANASRRGLTVFNEGAGNLHICAGATATTLAYQVRLSAGDYWECPAIQTSLTHSAQFASAGTARIVEIL